MTAAYADAVMSDDASQVAAAREGATETAIQFAVTFRSLERHARSQRDHPCRPTLWFMFQFTRAEDLQPVHVPARYAALAERIYDAARIHRVIVTRGRGALRPRTEFTSTVERDFATATIHVNAIGTDFLPAMPAAATALEAAGREVVELDLPLRDPATATLGSNLIDLGFGLAGVVPYPPSAAGQEDVLRFQRLGNVPTQTDDLLTISPLGDALLRTVLGDLDEARERRGPVIDQRLW
jgi:hypothetical protein